MPDTTTPEFAFADAMFGQCQILHDFLGDHVRPVSSGPGPDTVHGALIRAHGWMRTFTKLNSPGDFQAVVAGTRALFEIAVDLTLLLHDPESSVEKLVTWERSARFKAAEQINEFFTIHPTNRGFSQQRDHIVRESAAVHRDRLRFWPQHRRGEEPARGRHPDRWTGRSLRKDAAAAADRCAGERYAGTEFEATYVEWHPQWCWSTHGSGLAGVRSIPEVTFPALTGVTFRTACKSGLHIGRTALEYVGQYDEIAQVRFEKIAVEMDETAWNRMHCGDS